MGTRPVLCYALILAALLFASYGTGVKAQDTLSAEQMVKAREELIAHLKARRRADLEKLKYIMPGERLEDATLGRPYAFYRIEVKKVRSLTDYNRFKDCLTFFMWRIPVSFGSQARIILGEHFKDGEWKLASYGGDPSVIEEARSRWPESEGYKLSHVIQICGPDFIMVEKDGNIWLCPPSNRNEQVVGVTKDTSGQYPLLTVPHVVKMIKEQPEMDFDPTAR